MARCKTMGIIGGFSQRASFAFASSFAEEFKSAQGFQPHMLIENIPINVREEQLLLEGRKPSRVKALLHKSVRRLASQGADFIVIPCNTIHVFWDELQEKSPVPILNLLHICKDFLLESQITSVGLFATKGSIRARLHSGIFEHEGIKVVCPSKSDQRIVDMQIAGNIKNSKSGIAPLTKVANRLKRQGSQAILLGCTDFSLDHDKDGFIDSLQLLKNRAKSVMVS